MNKLYEMLDMYDVMKINNIEYRLPYCITWQGFSDIYLAFSCTSF